MIPRKIFPLTDLPKLKRHFEEDIVGEDRRLRFGISLPMKAIEEYLDKSVMNLGLTNQWFVIEDAGKIVATCHVNIYDINSKAELGITVAKEYRSKGFGSKLFERGTTWSRSRGASDVFMHCLAENKAIQRIASNHNMLVFSEDYTEKTALAKMNEPVLASYVTDRILEQIALYDMTFNRYMSFFKQKDIEDHS